MKKIIRVIQDNPDLMHLTWVINNICPNACSYCPSVLHNGQNHHYNWDNARIFFKMLFERYPKIHCSISGGEPSVSPFFKELVEIFHNAGHTVGITSNAAKPARFWEEVAPYLNYICFSYHPEFPDPNFIKKVEAASKHTRVTVRVMMHPQYWDQAVEMYHKLYALPHSFAEPVRLVDWGTQDKSIFNYTEEQLQFFVNNNRLADKMLTHISHIKPVDIISTFYYDDGSRQANASANDAVNAGLTNFLGYTCEVGLKSLFIGYQGQIYLGNCMIGNSIGTINEPFNVQWPTTPVVCPKTLCHCSSDVNINKWITNE